MRLIAKTYDPNTGFTEEAWYDDQTSKLTLRRLQDVEDTLAENRRLYNDHGKTNYADSDGLHHVAHIPFAIIEKWLREDGFNWYNSSDKERRAKLNHPDNRHLLVRPGKL
jgi:hypothetical protein